jgi:peptidoglycan/LPS O-acetylase OafA/YrhL
MKGRLPELDCLRGIAAMMVVVFHFGFGISSLPHFFKYGCTGVDLFFIISGFVILMTVEKTPNLKKFIVSRFARLYPAYWVALGITVMAFVSWAVLAKVPIHFLVARYFILHLTMVQYYWGIINFDGVYWTLLIELLFYVYISLLLLTKNTRRAELSNFIIVLFCLFYGTLLKNISPVAYHWLSHYIPILNYFPLFAAGTAFYKTKFGGVSLFRCLSLALYLAAALCLFNDSGRTYFIAQTEYNCIIAVFFIAMMLYCFNCLGFIVNRATLFLGQISYSLYLIHNRIATSILIPLFTKSHRFHFNFWVAATFIVLPIILIMATLLNKIVEAPAMRFLKKKLL